MIVCVYLYMCVLLIFGVVWCGFALFVWHLLRWQKIIRAHLHCIGAHVLFQIYTNIHSTHTNEGFSTILPIAPILYIYQYAVYFVLSNLLAVFVSNFYPSIFIYYSSVDLYNDTCQLVGQICIDKIKFRLYG